MSAPLHIGFTGTQRGMTSAQYARVKALVEGRTFIAHHGDCIGADQEFDEIVRGMPGLIARHIHPCTLSAKRAYCQVDVDRSDVLYPTRPPLVRNRDIVNAVGRMIGAPKGLSTEARSGTWSTIRYARFVSRLTLVIVWPDGGYTEENQ